MIGGVVVLGIGLGAVGLAPSSAARFTATTDTSYQLGTTTWMAFRQQVLALGPVSYWPMDETSGSVVSDAVGNNAMTYSGGPTVGMPGALYSSPGYSVGLTGTAQGTQTSTSPASLNLRGPMTVLAWVKLPATTTHNGRVVAKYAYSGTGGVSYMLALDNNTTSMRLLFDLTAGSPSRPVASVGVPSDQAWHLYAGTWDGSSVRVYRDGTPGTAVAVTGAGQLVSTTARVTVGAPGFSESVLGQIDEVAIWDRALTASEITSLYTAGTS